jgi:hypothetical protein
LVENELRTGANVTRRTVNLPPVIDATVREHALSGESYSATVSRLVELGARALTGPRRPTYVGLGEALQDLGVNAEEHLQRIFSDE